MAGKLLGGVFVLAALSACTRQSDEAPIAHDATYRQALWCGGTMAALAANPTNEITPNMETTSYVLFGTVYGAGLTLGKTREEIQRDYDASVAQVITEQRDGRVDAARLRDCIQLAAPPRR